MANSQRKTYGNSPTREYADSDASVPESGDESPQSRLPWPHAPAHRLTDAGNYIVTGSTYLKQLLFTDGPKLRMLHRALLTVAARHSWSLEAWAVFANHYHFVAASPGKAESLVLFIRELHARTAIALNRRDCDPGRQVWHNYWDSEITDDRSYFARLNYVHQNPVKHGLVRVANQYPYGSAAWFERTASPAQVRTVYGFKIDRVKVVDDF